MVLTSLEVQGYNSMFNSNGILKYSDNSSKLVVEVDPEISKYYFSLIPKYFKLNKQMFAPHISVVRNIDVSNMLSWNKYQNQEVLFEYESYIYMDETYCWLNIFASKLEDIRKELGLSPFGDVTLSPNGFHNFHMTIGNFKNR